MALQSSELLFSYNKDKSFSFPALRVAAGDSILVLGPSGAGKSTLLNILAGLLDPDQGEVKIAQQDLFALSPSKREQFRAQHIGMIFQKSFFLPYLSIAENIELALKLQKHPLSKSDLKEQLAILGIPHLYDKKPSECSVGEQQRASIARALLQKPSLLLADEPTSALDDENTKTVATLLKKLAKEQGTALAIVTHDQRLKTNFTQEYSL
jgi:putative ABC transport system ATP-binding protein